MNRGLFFDAEAVVFCGKTHEVLRRVDRIVDERTGRMRSLTSDAIVLKGVVCEARYAKCRHLCPRAIYPYFLGQILFSPILAFEKQLNFAMQTVVCRKAK